MPRCLDTDATYDIVLDGDKEKDKPPTFTYKEMSCREFRQLCSVYDKTDETVTDAMEDLFKALTIGLVGWRHMGTEFNRKELDNLLTPAEAYELLGKRLEASTMSADDKKK